MFSFRNSKKPDSNTQQAQSASSPTEDSPSTAGTPLIPKSPPVGRTSQSVSSPPAEKSPQFAKPPSEKRSSQSVKTPPRPISTIRIGGNHESSPKLSQGSPTGTSHPSTRSSVKRVIRRLASPVASTFSLGKNVEDLQLEADFNKEMAHTMQKDLEAFQKTAKETKEQLDQSRSELKDKEQTIRRLQNNAEDLKMTAAVNQEMLQDCKMAINVKDEKLTVLASQLENCRQQISDQEKQTSELQKTVREQADSIEFRMPALDLSGLVDPQNFRDVEVLAQEKKLLTSKIEFLEGKEVNKELQIKSLMDQISELREQLASKETSEDNTKRQLAEIEERYKVLYQEKDYSDENAEFSENANRDLQQQLVNLKGISIVNLEKKVQQQDSTIKEYLAEIMRLRKRVHADVHPSNSTSELRAERDQLLAKNLELIAEKEALLESRDKMDVNENEHRRLMQQLNKLTETNKQLEHKNASLRDHIHTAENTMSEQRRLIENFNHTAAELEWLKVEHGLCSKKENDEIASLRDYIRTADDKLKDQGKLLQGLNHITLQYEKLKAQHAHCSSDMDDRVKQLQQEIKEYQKQLEEVTLAYNNADANVELRIMDSISREQEARTELEGRLEQRDSTIGELKQRLSTDLANANTRAAEEEEKWKSERAKLKTLVENSGRAVESIKIQLLEERAASQLREEQAKLSRQDLKSRIDTHIESITKLEGEAVQYKSASKKHIDDLYKRYQAEANDAKARHQTELKEAKKPLETELKEAQKHHQKEIKDLQKKHESELKNVQRKDQAEASNTEKKLQAELRSLKNVLDPTRRKAEALNQAKQKLEEKCAAKDAKIAQLEREKKQAVDETFEQRLRESEEAYREDMHTEFRDRWRDKKARYKDNFAAERKEIAQRHETELETQRVAQRKAIQEELDDKYALEIANLGSKITSGEQQIATMQRLVSEKEAQLDSWRGKIERRDESIIALKKQASVDKQRIEQRNVACAEYETELDGYVKQIVDMGEDRKKVEEAKKKVDEEKKKITEERDYLKMDLLEKVKEVKELKSLLGAIR